MSNELDINKAVDVLMQNRGDRSPVIDLALFPYEVTKTVAEALCKTLISVSVDRVIFRHATDKVKNDFMIAHFMNRAKFVVDYV